MINKFTGVGRLAADCEIRTSQAGNDVATYTVCVDVGWGDNKSTEFVRCVSFGKLAAIVRDYSAKGNLVYVEGEMKTDKYQDSSGNDRYSTNIVVNTFKNLSPKGESSGDNGGGYGGQPSTGDDCPF